MPANRDNLADRRRFPRTATIPGTAIVLARNTMRVRLSIVDFSAGGAQLVGDLQLSIGESVRVQLQLNVNHALNFEAVVVRTTAEPGDRYRIAVAFRNVPTEIEDRLQRLVLSALERQRASAEPTVLVLDDEPEIRSSIARDLKAIGRPSAVVATPLDLVRRLHDVARRFDVALIDWQLGPTDGLDVIDYLAEDHPTIRRVLMSGKPSAWRDHERERGAGHTHAFLAKPWTRASLRGVLADSNRKGLAAHTREL